MRIPWVMVLLLGCGDDSAGASVGPGEVVQSLEGTAFAVDADAIYLTRGSGEVWRAPLDGSAPIMLATSGQLQSMDVAVDATHVYWLTLNASEIHRVPKLGGPSELIVATGALRGWLGVHGSTLYYTVDGTAPTSGINATPAAGGGSPTRIGPDARDTFVVTDANVFYAGKLGEVFRADLPSGPATAITPVNGEIISALAVTDTEVFYTSVASDLATYSTTRLRRIPIAGSTTPTVLWEADKSALHTGMVIDATDVYWIHFKDVVNANDIRSELYRARRSDGKVQLYAGPWTSVREITDDANYIYVMADGGTYRVSK